MKHPVRIASLALLILSVPFSAALAQKITPTMVFQVVSQTNAELELLYEQDLAKLPNKKNVIEKVKRTPGHVIQRARTALAKIQTLRLINGVTAKTIPPTPVRKVKPSDVKAIVDQLLADVRELRPVYKVAKKPATVTVAGKSPTDVYNNLARTLTLIDGLNIPKTAPNDVYQTAVAISRDILSIRQKLALPKKSLAGKKSKGKSPANAYDAGYALMVSLKSLGERSKQFAGLSKINLPTKRKSGTSPLAVLGLLNDIEAEIIPMKMMAGLASSSPNIRPQSGKTPSDVFDINARLAFLVNEIAAQ
jgi:hypothetical protein